MALRGSLKDFGLPDVFQLIQLSRKSGILRIRRPGAEGSIWFRDGDVFFAQSNWRRELLGQRLVAAQKITPSALARALEMRGAEPPGGRRLGQILVDEGYITQQILEAFVQEQIQDTIFDIMRWDEGEFDFEILPEVIQEDIGLSVSVENIVMEGSRRLEEWDRIRKRVPSTDMVFRMSTAPGEGTFEISLKPSEWNLLLLTDGTRSVRDLAVATRHTDFEVARTIYGLFSAGLLEVADDAEVEKRRADRARREQARLGRGIVRMGHGREAAAEATTPGVAPAVPGSEIPSPRVDAAGAAGPGGAEVERRDVEVPEFLARGGEEPSVEDLATFEQVLEAVLAQAEVVPPAEEAEESSAQTPPPADRAATAEAAEVETEQPGIQSETAAPTTEEPLPAAIESEVSEITGQIGAEVATAAAAGAEGVTVEHPAGEVMRTGDFEADLLRLGLGEYPEELRRQAEDTAPEAVSEALAVGEAAIADTASVAEPMSQYVREEPLEELAGEAVGLPGGEAREAEEETIGAAQTADAAEAPSEQPTVGKALRFEETASKEALYEPEVEAEVLAHESAPEQTAQATVESTPAEEEGSGKQPPTGIVFPNTAVGAEIGLGGGLGDELTALTGGGSGRARPMATVGRVPEPGESVRLHRDRMVDRDLLLRIIDGVERL